MTKVTNLSVEVLKYFSKEEIYDEYEYCGIKIYILSSLILEENVNIFMLPKIPFMKPAFSANGIKYN